VVFVVLTIFGLSVISIANGSLFIVVALCTGTWLMWLNQKGEEVPVTVGHSWNRDEEQRLLAQLKSINAALLHSAKD
jgi:threonine/homoserine/homoserine lactone efflux protein